MSLISAAGYRKVSLIAQMPGGAAATAAPEAAASERSARAAKH
jgi:hypothetical protein